VGLRKVSPSFDAAKVFSSHDSCHQRPPSPLMKGAWLTAMTWSGGLPQQLCAQGMEPCSSRCAPQGPTEECGAA
jgi:hypothetical protein